MSYSKQCKRRNEKLALSWWDARQCWRKNHLRRDYYFQHPDTKAGYETALAEFVRAKTKANEARPNFEMWQKNHQFFEMVIIYYNEFGVPAGERKLVSQVKEYLAWLDTHLEATALLEIVPLDEFCGDQQRSEFKWEFAAVIDFYTHGVGNGNLQFGKWADRFDRLEASQVKRPQTIGYWVDAYLERTTKRGGRFIVPDSAKDRDFKLRHFKLWAALGDHISTIDETYLMFCLSWSCDVNRVLEFSGSERESPNDEAQEFYG